MEETRNLVIALLVSVLILLVWQVLFVYPQREAQYRYEEQRRKEATAKQAATPQRPNIVSRQEGVEEKDELGIGLPQADTFKPRERIIGGTKRRVTIRSATLHGSLTLTGARFDDLTLAQYKQTKEPNSPDVALLSPSRAKDAYFAEFGWVAADTETVVPDAATEWQADREELTPETPVSLLWESPQSIRYHITISMDKNYMFTVEQTVENRGGAPAGIMPYGLVNRARDLSSSVYILHEGPLGVFDKMLHEAHYDDLREDKQQWFRNVSGWLGMTDKYWLTAFIPDSRSGFDAHFQYRLKNGQDRYQANFIGQSETIAPGERLTRRHHFFAGAKKIGLLDHYSATLNIPLFDRAVDFGWLYFLTRPMLAALKFFQAEVGNFGVAILMLTVVIRLILFPLANKSYRSMSKLKQVHPEMMKLRERYKNDKMKLNQAMMKFYKDSKISPLSGCLPILLQIPVFFALYKVLYVTIEMRHAPFFGWIQDLSAPDPTTVFNLFGFIQWMPYAWLPHIGVWPLLLGCTMLVQQHLNPPPPDPAQALVMKILPIVFIFIFASFPAGLVIYWTWSNLLSILQQWLITRSLAKKPTPAIKA